MVGTAREFLVYNEDNVMKQLLAIEDHLRHLSSNYKSEEASCVVKHILTLSEQCDEGISHASELNESEKAEIFRAIGYGASRLKDKLAKQYSPYELIKDVRELRRKAEKLNPIYNLEKCNSCGSVEETINKLKETLQKIKQPTFKELEENMARQVIKTLADKYGVQPPKLEISDDCHEPDVGVYMDGTIKLCRGGVNLHVILHEFGHYLQHKHGKPIDEAEAERFAIEVMSKNLYARHGKYEDGEKQLAVSIRDIAFVYGGEHIGKGIVRGLEFLDVQYPGAVFGLDPSLIVDVAGSVGGVLGGLYLKPPFDILSVLIGGYMSTDLWRHAEKMATPAAGVRFVPVTATKTETKVSGFAIKPEAEVVPTGTAPVGRYVITG